MQLEAMCLLLMESPPLLPPQGMVCIEAAVAGSGPLTIQPGSTWEGTSLLSYYYNDK